ncbi:MAG: DUF4325 domain-containing protein [Clostridia bacterium]|nr:DUF4325 domain-containing protein [Clostridia bacterium]
MANKNKEQIINYILKLIRANDKELVNKVIDSFEASKSTVYNYLKELSESKIIRKNEHSGLYELIYTSYNFEYNNNGSLLEDVVFDRDIAPLLNGLEKNVFSAWRYAFTEMMNNAIEHSKAEKIRVAVFKSQLEISIMLFDNGIGIFKNIQEYVKKEQNQDISLNDCAGLLFAGKFTTAKSMHSGEGIFFTSHLMDTFFILSDKVLFSRNNFEDFQLMSETNHNDASAGTFVFMSLYNHSKKTTKEVFDRFSNVDDGFIKTQIPIAHFFVNGNPVSRSEARRLGELIVKFKEINLDFAGVDEVGQAFCHELFIVWQNRNPDSVLNILNACDDVERMIKRVKNTK